MNRSATAFFAFLATVLALSSASFAQIGDVDLTFTERSPLSTKAELGRRLSIKQSEMGNDYDLPTCHFKAYIPKMTDPAAKFGIIVYLGYKDSYDDPYPWHPVEEKSHLIFITPVCHYGDDFPPSVPLWQMLGLAFDAVHNLSAKFPIDAKRVYEMSTDGGTQVAIAGSDVFTGAIISVDPSYYSKLFVPDGRYYMPQITRPAADLFPAARRHPIFIIQGTGDSDQTRLAYKLKIAAMKQDGFSNLQTAVLNPETDLHYPNLLPEWFEQKALPFLDSGDSGLVIGSKAATAPSDLAPAPPAPSAAQGLYSMAKLYVANNRPDLARTKLQQILDKYPDDPIVPKAKELLGQLPDQ